MRRLTITQTDVGQWVVETSGGVRTSGATAHSALNKLHPVPDPAEDYRSVELIFTKIPQIRTGQIHSGQAGA